MVRTKRLEHATSYKKNEHYLGSFLCANGGDEHFDVKTTDTRYLIMSDVLRIRIVINERRKYYALHETALDILILHLTFILYISEDALIVDWVSYLEYDTNLMRVPNIRKLLNMNEHGVLLCCIRWVNQCKFYNISHQFRNERPLCRPTIPTIFLSHCIDYYPTHPERTV